MAADLPPTAELSLADTAAPAPLPSPQPVSAEPELPPDAAPDERYEVRGPLGAGGMGEVALVRDRRIGRDVARKTIRADRGPRDEALSNRFIREARIQGQLEHPSLVPLYDLAIDERGRIYFTMKRVRGVTLSAILRAPDAHPGFTRHKLLTAFCSVCLAVDYAHRRGVVHRDLKPDNVMLGDFGEVYVLDWGVAKLAGVGEAAGGAHEPVDAGVANATAVGALVGTPGYMAPEQARGEASAVGPRADVYALGAILFELLTGERLHAGSDVLSLLDSTLKGADAHATTRCPTAQVAPELERVCVEATATDLAARTASARAVCDQIERYLEGDRDLQRRKSLARDYAERARAAAESASAPGPAGNEARAQALCDVTRALAFDSEERGAIGTLVSLLVKPPAEVPPEVERELAESEQRERREGTRLAVLSNSTWLLFAPVVALFVRSWAFAGLSLALIAVCVGVALWVRYRTPRPAPVRADDRAGQPRFLRAARGRAAPPRGDHAARGQHLRGPVAARVRRRAAALVHLHPRRDPHPPADDHPRCRPDDGVPPRDDDRRHRDVHLPRRSGALDPHRPDGVTGRGGGG